MKTLRRSFWMLLAVVAVTVRAAAPSFTPLGALSAQLHGPARVSVDAVDNLYVTDPAAGSVVMFNAFGQQTAVHDGFAGPLAIAIAGDGRIYLSEEQNRSVSVFDPQWNRLYQLGAGTNEFQLPGNLAVDPQSPDKVYVSDGAANLVRVFLGATQIGQFGGAGTGDGQFGFSTGISVRTNGEVFVLDQNNDRIEVFTNGVYARQFKLGSGGMFGGPSGRSQALLSDNAGRLYVADTLNGVVNVFDANTGMALGTVGNFGDAPGQLNMPLGLVLDGFNRLCVASANNARIELFGVDSFLHLSTTVVNGNLAAGGNLVFTAAVGGTNVAGFQWQKNGAALAGATNATLSAANVAAGASGNYSVVVSTTAGSITSSVASVTVLSPPNILSGPADQKLLAGATASFNVIATGDALNFQWQFNGVKLAGETNASLVLPAVSAAQSGQYAVTVTNAVGLVSAAPANLTVVTPPTVMDIVSSGPLAGAMFGLTVNLDPGYTYTVEASTNLTDWQGIATLTAAGLVDFVDTDATNHPNRFYRLNWTP